MLSLKLSACPLPPPGVLLQQFQWVPVVQHLQWARLSPHMAVIPLGAGKMQSEEHFAGDRSPSLWAHPTCRCAEALACREHLWNTCCVPGAEAQGIRPARGHSWRWRQEGRAGILSVGLTWGHLTPVPCDRALPVFVLERP